MLPEIGDGALKEIKSICASHHILHQPSYRKKKDRSKEIQVSSFFPSHSPFLTAFIIPLRLLFLTLLLSCSLVSLTGSFLLDLGSGGGVGNLSLGFGTGSGLFGLGLFGGRGLFLLSLGLRGGGLLEQKDELVCEREGN